MYHIQLHTGKPFLIPLPACCSHPAGILQRPSRSSSSWKERKFGVVVEWRHKQCDSHSKQAASFITPNTLLMCHLIFLCLYPLLVQERHQFSATQSLPTSIRELTEVTAYQWWPTGCKMRSGRFQMSFRTKTHVYINSTILLVYCKSLSFLKPSPFGTVTISCSAE